MDMLNEFQDQSYNEFLINKATALKIPITGTFELTPMCNMTCKMCYIQQDSKSIICQGGLKDLQFWNRVIDEAIEAGMLFCLLTGGEIFTYPHFKELYTLIKKKGVHLVLNTNATLIDENVIEWLAKDPPRRLNISLYGSSPETYKRLCNYEEGFERVIKAFKLLKENNIPFRVHGVLVPKNIDDFDGIMDICNQFNVPLQLSYYMFPSLRKENSLINIDERFTPEQMSKVALKYQYAGHKQNWEQHLKSIIDSVENYQQFAFYNDTSISCKAGSSTAWVTWKGKVNGCSIGNNEGYDLEKMSYKEAWEHIKEDTKQSHISKECSLCKYRSICPVCHAGAICETGKGDGTPQYLCDFSKKYYQLVIEEYKKVTNHE